MQQNAQPVGRTSGLAIASLSRRPVLLLLLVGLLVLCAALLLLGAKSLGREELIARLD